ncbi:tail sheath [Agrobacterium phage Atu_ph07]|uniref:Uncharacterized protein n=1 Tax=Agrobacterium phage Atu_ph07 TaxID=2024264 RepID=A0A223W0L7_9CAUD|nr:tail sheath [Agrobacterium phage Atu_ph07]ASV44717.1 hypothetical protein [Agrobacterium phage Atu_ph07]
MALDYFYDGQIRNYMLQFLRIFQSIHYSVRNDSDGNPVLKKIPAKFALKDALVGAILSNNSSNTAVSFPQITAYIDNLSVSPNRRQTPNHIDQVDIVEREYDAMNNSYLKTRGATYSAKRFMPVAYDMTMKVEIWTTNDNQKHQIMEQLLVLFNPSIDIQSNTNAVDWSSLTIVELTDTLWSSRSIPIGDTTTTVDSSVLTFNVPIWINPPAKIMKYNIIEQIVTNINHMDEALVRENSDPQTAAMYWSESDLLSRIIVTPGNHLISVDNSKITLLGAYGSLKTDGGLLHDWNALIEDYGTLRPGISQIRLKTSEFIEDFETDIVGTFELDPNEPNKISWAVDPMSLPSNTLPNVKGVIDPNKTYLGTGLPLPTLGDRYIIVGEIRPSNIWGDLTADANDIIVFDGTKWVKIFDASEEENVQFILNLQSGIQYKFVKGVWEYAVNKKYPPGYWRIFL